MNLRQLSEPAIHHSPFTIHSSTIHRSDSGVALVIVLAFIVLLTGLVVAFFSRSILDRQVSNSSASQTKVELFARGAIDTIVGDLKQEIVDGSTPVSTAGGTIYTGTPSTMMPAFQGFTPAIPITTGSETDGLANLLKRSAFNAPFYTGTNYNAPGIQRAAQISSNSTSINGRSISLSRWNKPLLMPATGANDLTPAASVNFTAPDWILVARDGSNPKTVTSGAASTAVVGRYAYTIYNEGGLLDINAAGYPTGVTASQMGHKGALAFADLTQLGLDQTTIDAIVGWRNYASSQVSGAFPSFNFTATSGLNYYNHVLSNTNGYLAAGTALSPDGQTDRMFTSRQHLIRFFQGMPGDKAKLQNTLQYLGTFSRTLNQPSYIPDPGRPRVSGPAYAGSGSYSGGNGAHGLDDTYNPAFRRIRVGTAFTRNDGTTAVVGEPLVKKRFALSRLLWLTYKGPSASVNSSDPLFQQYATSGLSAQTVEALRKEGTKDNILNYFGLTWVGTNGVQGGYWRYDKGITSGADPIIGTLDLVAAANREPNFFELLKAGICAGSLAKGWPGFPSEDPNNFYCISQLKWDSRVDFQIFQIGANIVDEADPDSFPTQIVFNDGSVSHSFWGKENLPYLSGVVPIGVVVTDATPGATLDGARVGNGTAVPSPSLSSQGQGVMLDVPVVWNPYAPSVNPVNPALAPAASGGLRVNASTVARDGLSTSAILGYFIKEVNPGFGINGGGPNNSAQTLFTWPFGAWNSDSGTVVFGSTPNGVTFNNNTSLYRDPTPLWQADSPSGVGVRYDSTSAFLQANPGWTNGIPEHLTGNKFFGFYVGTYPIRYQQPYNQGAGADPSVTGTNPIIFTAGGVDNWATLNGGPPITYSLEYLSGGTWIPYMQYGSWHRFCGRSGLPWFIGGATAGDLNKWLADINSNGGGIANVQFTQWDPRTARWRPWAGGSRPGGVGDLDSTTMTIGSLRPAGAAATFEIFGTNISTAGWNTSDGYFGNVCQNLYSAGSPKFYYGDADGVVRRGMAGAISQFSPGSAVGQPLASFSNAGSYAARPIMLDRPFRSVAELGYVFRDTPWKNLDFSNPESGDAALLDLFCINDTASPGALVAGRVDLNTRQAPVIQSILAGAYQDELGVTPALAATQAATIAGQLLKRTTSTGTGNGPLTNIADLVGRYVGTANPKANNQPYDGFTADLNTYTAGSTALTDILQRYRETSIRALSDTGMAGTWNLMVDVIAQTGRYPASASGLSNFVVEGERRYWVHVAIDRQTGEVIDQSVEVVHE